MADSCPIQFVTATASHGACAPPPSPAPGRDEQLLLDYAATGNQEVFATLVRLYEREIYRYLFRRLGDRQLAEDAAQNTFLQVHRRCRQFQAGRRLRPWLYTIAGNQAIDLLRRNRRRRMVSLGVASGNLGGDGRTLLSDNDWSAEATDPGNRLKSHEDRERMGRALRLVPEKARQVLVLVVYQALSYRAAAAVLGIPVGTVKSRMHAALQSLRRALLLREHVARQAKRGSSILREA